jgi:predicted nuclease of restriction endonuclease-like RecB superfamily
MNLFFRLSILLYFIFALEISKMTSESESFHPRLIIVNHFDRIINEIDIKTETLLENQIFPEETRKQLNESREKQVQKLKEIKESNLKHLPQNIDEKKYKEKWAHVIEDNSLEYEHKIDKIKEELILEDCVLLDNPNEINGFSLWITSSFYNEKDLKFLK